MTLIVVPLTSPVSLNARLAALRMELLRASAVRRRVRGGSLSALRVRVCGLAIAHPRVSAPTAGGELAPTLRQRGRPAGERARPSGRRTADGCTQLQLLRHFHIGASVTAMSFYGKYPWASHAANTRLTIGGTLLFTGK